MKKILIAIMMVLCLAGPGWAAIRYVSSTGSNTTPYDTWAKASTTIQPAVNWADNGDEVWLDDETHTLTARISLNGNNEKIALIRSRSNNPDTCIIAGDGTNAWGISFASDAITDWDIEFRGIKFYQCKNTEGGAIRGGTLCHVRNLTITNCKFDSCIADTTSGGGIYFDSGHATAKLIITGSTFSNNVATVNGGAIMTYENLEVLSSIFTSNNGGTDNGGAILAGGPNLTTLEDIILTDNTVSTNGGGVYVSNAACNVVATNITGTGNTAIYGGVFSFIAGAGTINITNLQATSNRAARGAGIFTARTCIVNNSTFTANLLNFRRNIEGDCCGAGILFLGSTTFSTLNNCTFDGNVSMKGSGFYDSGGAITTANRCTFKNNFCDRTYILYEPYLWTGGGAAVGVGADTPGDGATLNYCLIYDNSSNCDGGGGALHILNQNKPKLNNCVIYNNSIISPGTGNAVHKGSIGNQGLYKNCILWGNSTNNGNGLENVAGINIDYSCHQGTLGANIVNGGHNITSNPLFANVETSNFCLNYNSPCRDAGVYLDLIQDFALLTVPRWGLVDMGAYEYQYRPIFINRSTATTRTPI